ncbi:MAG: hypothetical protein J1E43_10955 [Christensenellaceae bacterium]|nr:hypothetical protein [Christensenellaceae bacterium]
MKKLFTVIICALLLLTCAASSLAEELTAFATELTVNQDYSVYSAPDEFSPRSAENDALITAGSSYQAYGEENGWILIQYAVDEEHARFGYILAEALPEGVEIEALDWNTQYAHLMLETALTDDPLQSQSELLTLPEGQMVTVLAMMDGWVYVESEAGDWVRGFVRQDQLRYDSIYYLADHSENLATGTLAITPYGQLTLVMGVKTEDVPAAFLLKDELQDIEIGKAELTEDNDYRLDGTLPEGTTSISFIPVDEDGTQGETLFRVEW